MGTDKDWTELKRETVFEKFGRKVERVDFRLPNGVEADYYIKDEGEAAAVLALTPENEVILARQFRPGPNRVLDELPGGMVDAGEEPLEAIRHELLEETGYEGDIEFVGSFVQSAYSSRMRHCFVARNCRKVAEPVHTDTEHTEVVLMSLDDFRQHLRSGELSDTTVGYRGLDHAGLL